MRLATLILPTTGNDGTDHTDTHAALRLILIDAFGGFTVTTGDGGGETTPDESTLTL